MFERTLGIVFTVRITPAARAHLGAVLGNDPTRPRGVGIYRRGSTGDVKRSHDGDVLWAIERRSGWDISVVSFPSHPDEVELLVDGIRVDVAAIPKPGESGLLIDLQNGALTVEAFDA